MKKIAFFSVLLSITCGLYVGCESTSSNDTVTVTGVVINSVTGDAISDAIVEVVSPDAYATVTVTDENGAFSLEFVDVSETITLNFQVTKTGYIETSFQIAISSSLLEVQPEDPITLTPISSGDDDDDDGVVSGPSEGAATIVLKSISETSISIKETGGIVNSVFTFQVQDSSGRNLDLNNAVDVTFSILNGPNGGEGILPLTVTTNGTGQATSSLFSGNAAGVVQIQAQIVREDVGLIITSEPVAITIHGGFPDKDHFSLTPDVYNFEGYSIAGNTNTITAIIGDKYSNPVKPGTAVYFRSTGGIIEGSSTGHTNDQGFATVQLISGGQLPDDSQTIDGTPFPRKGLATIIAQTVNGDNEVIEDSINVVFSTSSALISANPTTFDTLAPGGGATFNYTVTDLNGNPMAEGTTIVVDAGEGIELTGDANVTLGSSLFPGPGATEFTFSIRDIDEESNEPADLSISITVTSPSGEITSLTPISGVRRKAFK